MSIKTNKKKSPKSVKKAGLLTVSRKEYEGMYRELRKLMKVGMSCDKKRSGRVFELMKQILSIEVLGLVRD